MKIPFYKYQGTGNDFIIIDNRNLDFDCINQELINRLCHRRFGVGGDGLLLLEKAEGYDFRMIYFNSDGNEGSMCGNGGRCIVALAFKLGVCAYSGKFIAIDGEHQYKITETDNSQEISLKMLDVNKVEKGKDFFFLNTGSPHYVTFVENASETDVYKLGKEIRYNERFKIDGTNVNFVEIYENGIKVRTYERGVENETLSCGTGVTAAALCASLKSPSKTKSTTISTLGGELKVHFNQQSDLSFCDIWLQGPAMFVYKGEIVI